VSLRPGQRLCCPLRKHVQRVVGKLERERPRVRPKQRGLEPCTVLPIVGLPRRRRGALRYNHLRPGDASGGRVLMPGSIPHLQPALSGVCACGAGGVPGQTRPAGALTARGARLPPPAAHVRGVAHMRGLVRACSCLTCGGHPRHCAGSAAWRVILAGSVHVACKARQPAGKPRGRSHAPHARPAAPMQRRRPHHDVPASPGTSPASEHADVTASTWRTLPRPLLTGARGVQALCSRAGRAQRAWPPGAWTAGPAAAE